MNTTEVIDKIRDVARRVLPKGSKLYLYGSHARGDYHDGSDWDLLVLLQKQRSQQQDFDEFAYPIMEAGFDMNEYFSVQTYTQNAWAQQSFTPYYKNVEHDKIVLL